MKVAVSRGHETEAHDDKYLVNNFCERLSIDFPEFFRIIQFAGFLSDKKLQLIFFLSEISLRNPSY